MIPLPSFAPLILAAAIGAAGGALIAAKLSAAKTARVEAQLARCAQDKAEAARAAAENTARLLSRAQDAQAQAARRLAAQQAAFEHRLKEARSEVYRLTTGRECLAPALRLRLNAALGHAERLPAPAGAADAAAAESAADSGHGRASTDADLAHWILDAASRYDDCRARIDALREWSEVTHGR